MVARRGPGCALDLHTLITHGVVARFAMAAAIDVERIQPREPARENDVSEGGSISKCGGRRGIREQHLVGGGIPMTRRGGRGQDLTVERNSGIRVALDLPEPGGGVRTVPTVQHLAERGVQLLFEVWPCLGARGCSRSPEAAPERPKYTVLSGHVFIWSQYLQIVSGCAHF